MFPEGTPYQKDILFESKGVFGHVKLAIAHGDGNRLWDCPIVQAWLADNDYQQLRLTSTCIGVIRTLTKQYVTKPKPGANAPL